jgi:four helix bundle protein
MKAVETYRDLETWQAGMSLVEKIYAVTRAFPREELFGLTSQLRRAAVSVPSNVAEGACRRTTAVYVNHVSIALGSHAEIETCFEIAVRLKYVQRAESSELMGSLERTGQLLNGLLRSLQSKAPR